MSDRQRLYCAAFLRALATGMIGVLLGVYLARRGLDAAETGIIVTSGLSGAAIAALIATLAGQRAQRQRVLLAPSPPACGRFSWGQGASKKWQRFSSPCSATRVCSF